MVATLLLCRCNLWWFMFKSCNIWSGSSDGLSAALTNCTELAFKKGKLKNHYPIVDKNGVVFPDAETAYKLHKTGDIVKDRAIMIRIIAAKLRQYPRLTHHITARGGIEWLQTCSHIVGVKGSRWEGVGTESNFISCLIAAYEVVVDE